jgi:hypothetical protein
MDDILSIIPSSRPIREFLKYVPQGKILSGALSLVDFAAKALLIYSFALKPYEKEIREFSSTFDKIYRKLLEKMREDVVLRGTFFYDFGDDGPLAGYTIKTRSKVVSTFFDESPIISMMPLSATGLDPSASNLWDLVPFSFVLDWFFQFGSRLESFEQAAHMMISDIRHLVHSFTLEDKDPADYGNFDLSGARYDFYYRDVSRVFPTVRNHYYDWYDKGSPPMLIGGALLWTLIRSKG